MPGPEAPQGKEGEVMAIDMREWVERLDREVKYEKMINWIGAEK